MRRVSVVGVPGSGKTTLGRSLSEAMGVPFVELDGLFHQPGWTEPAPEEFRARVSAVVAAAGRVVDGNYPAVQEGIWERADTVVWLDLPRPVAMRRVVARTVRRVVTRQQLWNGNREPLTNLYRWDPEVNVIRWAWVHYPEYARRYGRAMDHARRHGGPTWIRLTSDRAVGASAQGWADGATT